MSGFGSMAHGAGPVGSGEDTAPAGINPIIVNFVPERGEEIAANEPVQFDIVDPDNGALEFVVVAVSYQTGSGEVIDLAHDGTDFRGKYTNSLRSAVPNGFRYVLSRDGGWPSTPTVEFFVVDDQQLEGEIDDS